jgi:hypothetical protein
MDSVGSGLDPMAGFCEYANEPLGSVKDEECPDWQSGCQCQKKAIPANFCIDRSI